LRPSGTATPTPLLDRGELDLAIGNFADPSERFAIAPLVEDHFVLAMRSDHPARETELTAETFAALSFLDISSSGEDTSFVDDWLTASGLTRNIAHRAPRLSAAAVLSGSDMVVVLSRRLGKTWVKLYGLSIRPLPFASPLIRTGMLWHRRLDNQPAHAWLRGLVREMAADK
jgi:DNA-binding transcriptional LysR family regulator